MNTKNFQLIRQQEQSECGLACVAMICEHYGVDISLNSLRADFATGGRGINLKNLSDLLSKIGFRYRHLRLELEQVRTLELPCILHWRMNHFVVLTKASKNRFTIYDPAEGVYRFNRSEFSASFTGIATELFYTADCKLASGSARKVGIFQPGLKRDKSLLIYVLPIVIELLTLASPFYIQLAVDQVMESNDQNLMFVIAMLFGALCCIQYLLQTIHLKNTVNTARSLADSLGYETFQKAVSLPVSFFSTRTSNNIISKFTSLLAIVSFEHKYRSTALVAAWLIVAALIVSSIISIHLALCTAAFGIVYGVSVVFISKNQRHALRQKSKMKTRSDNIVLDTIRNIKQIQSARVQEESKERFFANYSSYNYYDATAQSITLKSVGLLNLLLNLHRIFVVVIAAGQISNGSLSIGGIFAYLLISSRFFVNLSSISNYFIHKHENQYHLDNLEDLYSYPAEVTQFRRRIRLEKPDIALKDVCFRHSPSTKWIMYNCDISIRYGEKILLRGKSGGGKSTLISLLSGNLKANSGKQMLSGFLLEETGPDSFRSHFSIMMQDDQIVSGTILDNIIYSRSNISFDNVFSAAEAACIHDDIITMPMGYNTLLSGAANILSAGQKQRILLARALAEDAPVLMLDEATSNLDLDSKKNILKHILNLDKTVIVISHDDLEDNFSRVIDLDALNRL